MSKLRPECGPSKEPALDSMTALYLIRDSVARRRALIHGKLHAGGQHCAIGCFWTDNPGTTLASSLIDEVATVNDSLGPRATPHQRWKKVNSWLRWKLRVLTGDA